jgi:hypothetical protein
MAREHQLAVSQETQFPQVVDSSTKVIGPALQTVHLSTVWKANPFC